LDLGDKFMLYFTKQACRPSWIWATNLSPISWQKRPKRLGYCLNCCCSFLVWVNFDWSIYLHKSDYFFHFSVAWRSSHLVAPLLHSFCALRGPDAGQVSKHLATGGRLSGGLRHFHCFFDIFTFGDSNIDIETLFAGTDIIFLENFCPKNWIKI
jgi:hypothetical protein